MEGRDWKDRMGDGHGVDVSGHGMTAHAALGGELGDVEQPAALVQKQPQQREEPGPVSDAEEFGDVPRVVAVHPLSEERGIFRLREQRFREPTMQ